MPATQTRDFDSPYAEPMGIKKPSQAEGERDQPGEEKREQDGDPDTTAPAKPSQAEGERKPYQ